MTCPRSHSGQSPEFGATSSLCSFCYYLCVSDLEHVSESNKNQNKSLLVYLQFSMSHTSASVHLCKLLRMDIMYIFLLPDLSSFKQPAPILGAVRTPDSPFPSQSSFPTCAAETLLLSALEGTPAPLGLALVGLKIGQTVLKCNPKEAVNCSDSPQIPGNCIFKTNLKIAAQKALQLEEPGVNSVQFNTIH